MLTACLVTTRGFHFYSFLPRLGAWSYPTVPPLNIAIIPWQQLGHIVLVIKAGSHLWVQSRIQSFIQSCAGVRTIFLPCQLTQPLYPFHCIQHPASVTQATMISHHIGIMSLGSANLDYFSMIKKKQGQLPIAISQQQLDL